MTKEEIEETQRITFFNMHDRDLIQKLLNEKEKEIEELKQNALKFPTLAEFSNLQDDLDKAKSRIKELEREILYYPPYQRKWCKGCLLLSEANKAESRIKELEEERDGAIEAWHGREKAIDQALSSIKLLKDRIKELEEGIELHKQMIALEYEDKKSFPDIQLYKLIEK